jgi:hypothetical protein
VQKNDRLDLPVWPDYPVDGGYIVLGPQEMPVGGNVLGTLFTKSNMIAMEPSKRYQKRGK